MMEKTSNDQEQNKNNKRKDKRKTQKFVFFFLGLATAVKFNDGILNTKRDKRLNQIRQGQQGHYQSLKCTSHVGRVKIDRIDSTQQKSQCNTYTVVE